MSDFQLHAGSVISVDMQAELNKHRKFYAHTRGDQEMWSGFINPSAGPYCGDIRKDLGHVETPGPYRVLVTRIFDIKLNGNKQHKLYEAIPFRRLPRIHPIRVDYVEGLTSDRLLDLHFQALDRKSPDYNDSTINADFAHLQEMNPVILLGANNLLRRGLRRLGADI